MTSWALLTEVWRKRINWFTWQILSAYYKPGNLHFVIQSMQHFSEAGTFILCSWTLRFREVKCPGQGHITDKGCSQDWSLSYWALQPQVLTHACLPPILLNGSISEQRWEQPQVLKVGTTRPGGTIKVLPYRCKSQKKRILGMSWWVISYNVFWIQGNPKQVEASWWCLKDVTWGQRQTSKLKPTGGFWIPSVPIQC